MSGRREKIAAEYEYKNSRTKHMPLKIRAVLLCALIAAIMVFSTGCRELIDWLIEPDTTGARVTATPDKDALPTNNNGGPDHGYEPLVTPLLNTPADPMAPENYPLPDEFRDELTLLLSRASGNTVFKKIYNIVNDPNGRTPLLYYEHDDLLNEFPGYLELAQYLLKNCHGVCYHFASLTCYLLRVSGYEAYVIHGYRYDDLALHYWTVVKTDKGWYHFDPLHHQMLLTDAQKSSNEATRGNGLTWQAGIWPESSKEIYNG
ncbi:MAG: transglutaminase domain-containing protein [Clostridia bacterium]|nr:transglutaminase domain-containing protein [Clostridia bacterium]